MQARTTRNTLPRHSLPDFHCSSSALEGEGRRGEGGSQGRGAGRCGPGGRWQGLCAAAQQRVTRSSRGGASQVGPVAEARASGARLQPARLRCGVTRGALRRQNLVLAQAAVGLRGSGDRRHTYDGRMDVTQGPVSRHARATGRAAVRPGCRAASRCHRSLRWGPCQCRSTASRAACPPCRRRRCCWAPCTWGRGGAARTSSELSRRGAQSCWRSKARRS